MIGETLGLYVLSAEMKLFAAEARFARRVPSMPNLQEWASWGTYQQAGITAVVSLKTWAGDASAAGDNLINRALNFLMAK